MSKFNYDPDLTSITWNTEQPKIKPEAMDLIKEAGLVLRSEFHVTIVHSQIGAVMGLEKLERFYKALGSGESFEVEYSEELYLLEKDKVTPEGSYPRKSIIAKVVNSTLRDRCSAAASASGVDAPDTFLHLTIATTDDNEYARRGIGIPTASAWEEIDTATLFVTDWIEKK